MKYYKKERGSKDEKKYCKCRGHRSKDFRVVTDLYCNNFIPTNWKLVYHTLAEYAEERYLHLEGKCNICGGFMTSGTSVPYNRTGEGLIECIWGEYTRYRPYCGFIEREGSYVNDGLRNEFYTLLDNKTIEEKFKEFRNLFKEEDLELVNEFLEKNREIEEDKLNRKRKEESRVINNRISKNILQKRTLDKKLREIQNSIKELETKIHEDNILLFEKGYLDVVINQFLEYGEGSSTFINGEEDVKEIIKLSIEKQNKEILEVFEWWQSCGTTWTEQEIIDYVKQDDEVFTIEEILSWGTLFRLQSGLIVSWEY